jgi:hypothetical protein
VLTVSSEGSWSFSLVGQVGYSRYFYVPRSDMLLSFGVYPLMVVEKCSDRKNEQDRSRMLLQTGLLTRVMNSLKPQESRPFVAVAIYLNGSGVAERYIFYPSEEMPSRVRITNVSHAPLQLIFSLQIAYIQEDFLVKNPIDRFRFFFELHNLPSALPFNPDLFGTIASNRYAKLKRQVNKANFNGYILTETRTGTVTGSGSQSNNSRGKRSQPFRDRATVRMLSNAGYQVLQEVNRVRSSWFYFVAQH